MMLPLDEPSRPLAIHCAMAFTSLINDLHRRLDEHGITDLRPAHGFVFQRVAGTGATAAEIAVHLGIARQSTQQILDDLTRMGYLRRTPHPSDRRSSLVQLTPKGLCALKIVEEAFRGMDKEWRKRLGAETYALVAKSLNEIAQAGKIQGPLRPVW